MAGVDKQSGELLEIARIVNSHWISVDFRGEQQEKSFIKCSCGWAEYKEGSLVESIALIQAEVFSRAAVHVAKYLHARFYGISLD